MKHHPVNVKVIRRNGESLDSLLKFFNEKCKKEGIMEKIRSRESYDSPSVKLKNKSRKARKRAMNQK